MSDSSVVAWIGRAVEAKVSSWIACVVDMVLQLCVARWESSIKGS